MICEPSVLVKRKFISSLGFYSKYSSIVIQLVVGLATNGALNNWWNPSSAKLFHSFIDAISTATDSSLYFRILLHPDKPFNVRYDFIFNRLRAVRQELVMQNFSPSKTLMTLEPIVMFLSFSLYRLNGSPIAAFDPKICSQHLQECLLKCLTCYEELKMFEPLYNRRRTEIIEGIYIILNMGDTAALQRAVRLDSSLKSSFIIRTAIKISLNFHLKNFYKVICDIQTLPHLLCALASLKLPQIRKEIFKMFSIAYNSRTLSVPTEFLRKLLLYEDNKILIKDLRQLGIDGESDDLPTHVIFNKAKFDASKPIVSFPRVD